MTFGPVVIVGAGHAGFQLGMSLRQNGFGERIVLLNDEGHLPYQRPPLSKGYLKGTGGPETLMIGKVLWQEFFNNRDWPVASALAVVMLAILIVPIILFNRSQAKEMEGKE